MLAVRSEQAAAGAGHRCSRRRNQDLRAARGDSSWPDGCRCLNPTGG